MPTPRHGPVCHGRKAFAGEGGGRERERGWLATHVSYARDRDSKPLEPDSSIASKSLGSSGSMCGAS